MLVSLNFARTRPSWSISSSESTWLFPSCSRGLGGLRPLLREGDKSGWPLVALTGDIRSVVAEESGRSVPGATLVGAKAVSSSWASIRGREAESEAVSIFSIRLDKSDEFKPALSEDSTVIMSIITY